MNQSSSTPPVRESLDVPVYRKVGKFLRRLFVYVLPDNCPLCDAPLHNGEHPLCLNCLAGIPRFRSDSEMVVVGVPGNTIRVKSWFVYHHEDASHRLIHDIKYHDRCKLARKLGREFAMQKLMDETAIDVILPIPLHWTKRLLRGYNQSREIARGIRDVTGISVGKHLYATRLHGTQTRSNREQRADNVKGTYAVRKGHELNGKHVALLDDVITTGSTMSAALDALMEVATPASVTFLSLARTRQL